MPCFEFTEFEAGFLRLLEKVTNGSHVEISYTGTSVLYRPGVIAGGVVIHDCGTARPIGYFLEGILCLAPFGKKELNLTLKGITTGEGDLSVSRTSESCTMESGWANLRRARQRSSATGRETYTSHCLLSGLALRLLA